MSLSKTTLPQPSGVLRSSRLHCAADAYNAYRVRCTFKPLPMQCRGLLAHPARAVRRPSPRCSCAGSASEATPPDSSRRSALAAAAGLLLALPGPAAGPALAAKPTQMVGDEAKLRSAVAVLRPTRGSAVQGTVSISEAVTRRGRVYVRVSVRATGLTPGLHGVNVHELAGAACDDGLSCGASFNPAQLPHGLRDTVKSFGAQKGHYLGDGSAAWRHVGDWGNVKAGADGVADESWEEPVATLADGPACVLGRAVVLHAAADDGVAEPAAVVAYGVLQRA